MTLLTELGGWPIIDKNPSNNISLDLVELLSKLRLLNNRVLLNLWVSSDDKNSSVNTIHVRIDLQQLKQHVCVWILRSVMRALAWIRSDHQLAGKLHEARVRRHRCHIFFFYDGFERSQWRCVTSCIPGPAYCQQRRLIWVAPLRGR
jgi:hypothetical protein